MNEQNFLFWLLGYFEGSPSDLNIKQIDLIYNRILQIPPPFSNEKFIKIHLLCELSKDNKFKSVDALQKIKSIIYNSISNSKENVNKKSSTKLLWVSTVDVSKAAKISIVTAKKWSLKGLLPKYEIVYYGEGNHSKYFRWPVYTIDQARWVREMLDLKFSFTEILKKLETMNFEKSEKA